MKIKYSVSERIVPVIILAVILTACNSTSKKGSNMAKEKGTYGYDVDFLKNHDIATMELSDASSNARVLVVPGLQGRVMTSTADAENGSSYGWINYKLVKSGEVSEQFNPYGGEERFWIGPEGGPFSIYFRKGDEQVFSNWRVPKEIDTDAYDIVEQSSGMVRFSKKISLENASGTTMEMGVDRTVKMISKPDAEQILQLPIDDSLNFVAFETDNILTNTGNVNWDEQNGFVSIWLLCMFNPSEQGVVVLPYKKGEELGKIVTDDYFGKVPAERLIVKENAVFFKTDGKLRSKIGIPPQRALPYCGSYDPINKVLTILWYSKPEADSKYVNSVWGEQEDPLSGDVVNSYNDGPTDDGSIMGPFYEIESSSPAALLKAGEQIQHVQRIFHISGNENKLNEITEKLLGVSIEEIKSTF